jgi:PAS domain-containing protein
MNLSQQQVQTMSMELYQSLIADMPLGVMVANTAGEFILWNDQAAKLFKEELKITNQNEWAEQFGVFRLDKETRYKTEEIPMSRALNGEYVENEKLFIRNNGTPEGIYIKITAYPLMDQTAQVIAGVVIFEDITKEQQMYDSVIGKINELEDYLRTVLNLNKR